MRKAKNNFAKNIYLSILFLFTLSTGLYGYGVDNDALRVPLKEETQVRIQQVINEAVSVPASQLTTEEARKAWTNKITNWVKKDTREGSIPPPVVIFGDSEGDQSVITELRLPLRYNFEKVTLTPEWNKEYGYVIRTTSDDMVPNVRLYHIGTPINKENNSGGFLKPIKGWDRSAARGPELGPMPQGTIAHWIEGMGPIDINRILDKPYATAWAGGDPVLRQKGGYAVRQIEITAHKFGLPTSGKRIKVTLPRSYIGTNQVMLHIDPPTIGTTHPSVFVKDPKNNQLLATVTIDLTNPSDPKYSIKYHIIRGQPFGNKRGRSALKDPDTRKKEGEFLRSLRDALNLSREKFAKEILPETGNSPQNLEAMEKGRVSIRDESILRAEELALNHFFNKLKLSNSLTAEEINSTREKLAVIFEDYNMRRQANLLPKPSKDFKIKAPKSCL